MADWRSKVHEIDFSKDELAKLKRLYAVANTHMDQLMTTLVVDNCGIKVRSTEYYNCYTISFTFDKKHPTHGGHSYWLYDTDILRGLWAIDFYLREWLPDAVENGVMREDKGLF